MSSEDIKYFRERAAIEGALARSATGPVVAQVHEELARGYQALLREEELRRQMRGIIGEDQRSATT